VAYHRGRSFDRSCSRCTIFTADLPLLIEGHGLFPHLNADDTHGLCRPSATLELQNSISTCIDDVARWMRTNWIQLNTAKTEILWSTSSRRLPLLPVSPIRIGTDKVMPVSVDRHLGIYMDADVSMSTHVRLKDYSCLFCESASTAEYSSISSALCSSVTGFVSRSATVGLWQRNAVWHFIPSHQADAVGVEFCYYTTLLLGLCFLHRGTTASRHS